MQEKDSAGGMCRRARRKKKASEGNAVARARVCMVLEAESCRGMLGLEETERFSLVVMCGSKVCMGKKGCVIF